jgi:signal transduction histidine kinase
MNQETIRVGIEVSDTGFGIPEDKQKVIFEKLHRLTPTYEKNIEGSGIGLYIVDQYVKRMGGEILVKSNVGEGSTFIVMLPLAIVADVTILPLVSAQSSERLVPARVENSAAITTSIPVISPHS